MTTQTLMANCVSELSRVQAGLAQQDSTQRLEQSIGTIDNPGRIRKLPYQATHQAELLHLQADIDALLQQLQALQQQRLVSSDCELSMQSEPVLA